MKRLYQLIIAVIIMFLPVIALTADDGVPRIAKEELKTKMEQGEDILVLDVRTGMSYTGSKTKIKGAIRFAPNDIDVWSKNLPKDKEIITYCT